jgi:hypothetical protein
MIRIGVSRPGGTYTSHRISVVVDREPEATALFDQHSADAAECEMAMRPFV